MQMSKPTSFFQFVCIFVYLTLSMSLMTASHSTTSYERCETAWATSPTKFSTGWGSYETLTPDSPNRIGSIMAAQTIKIGIYAVELLSSGYVQFRISLHDPDWVIRKDPTSTSGTVSFYAGQSIPTPIPDSFPMKLAIESTTRANTYFVDAGCKYSICGTVYATIHFEVCKKSSTPTNNPTELQNQSPTALATNKPTNKPTRVPTKEPTDYPTDHPTTKTTSSPTNQPTTKPTRKPTSEPTEGTTTSPTNLPTETSRCDVAWAKSANRFSSGWGSYAKLSRKSPTETGSIIAGQIFNIGTYTMKFLGNGDVKFTFSLTEPGWRIQKKKSSAMGTVSFYADKGVPNPNPGSFPLKAELASTTRTGVYSVSTSCTSPNCGSVYSAIHFEVCR